MHTAFGGLRNVAGIGVMGEHDDRARYGLPYDFQRLKPRAGGLGHITNKHIWCMQHHGLHQFAAVRHRAQHGNARCQ